MSVFDDNFDDKFFFTNLYDIKPHEFHIHLDHIVCGEESEYHICIYCGRILVYDIEEQ